MKQFAGLWYPDADELTKNFKARAQTEPFYRADRFHDAMKHVKQWRGAVECGAHVGEWSRELATRFERVVAIEMNPASAECLRANLPAHPNVIVVNHAVGAHGGQVQISGKKNSMGNMVAGDGEDVWLDRLDDLTAVKETAAIDYLNVHVNGYELEVLLGAKETIAKHCPVTTVVIKRALADYGATPEDIFKFMDRVGYRVASCLKPYWVFVPA